MKKTTKLTAVIVVGFMAVALAACGKKPEPVATDSGNSESSASTVSSAPVEADLSNPDIVIEFGDSDGISELGSKAQNFEIEEGTVVKIHGLMSTGGSNPSISQEVEGGRIGIVMILDAAWDDAPADGTEIEAVGVYQKGQYSMEFHVDPANITILG